jgi:hypothetical protein
MDAVYVPAHVLPCEPYWMALLEEGPISRGESPGRGSGARVLRFPLAFGKRRAELRKSIVSFP